MEFAHFLGEKGLHASYPILREDGEVVQILKEGKYHYIAYTMDYVDGTIRKTEELDSNMVREWGKLTGKLHAATKSYPDWKSIPGGNYSWGIEEELDGFYHMCHNEIVKEKWIEMRKELNTWEKDRNTYGFTHNDNHQNNILVNDKGLTLIDFDCAECTFFLQDILIPSQGILFDQTGGFNCPITDMDTIKKFYESFLSGYETENHIEDKWLTRLETLLNYRRLILFTIMQDWMEADEKIGTSFLDMIQNPCSFSIL